jgi:hypothetical protein
MSNTLFHMVLSVLLLNEAQLTSRFHLKNASDYVEQYLKM